MNTEKQQMFQLAKKLGVVFPADSEEAKRLTLNHIKVVDLLPEMLIMVRSLISMETFSYRRKQIDVFEKGLIISFQNMFDIGGKEKASTHRGLISQPHVRIIPSHLESEVLFPKDVHIHQITVLIEIEYLKHFIGKDHQKLRYLFDAEKTFWIEEFMSPEMAALVNEFIDFLPENVLSQAYFRLKALELIYLLFRNLLNRDDVEHHNLSNYEIDSVYLVRNEIQQTIEQPFAKEHLVRISGMNELKLRRVFTQVFGKGLYTYYNHLRMQEAARLLLEDDLSVSDVGYRLGFSNLSYFGRLFEQHHGLKPKKWRRKNSRPGLSKKKADQ